MAKHGEHGSGWESPRVGERSVFQEGFTPGKLTRAGLLPSTALAPSQADTAANGPAPMGPWEADGFMQALGLAPDDPRWSEDQAPAGPLALGNGEAASGASASAPLRASGQPLPAAAPLDLAPALPNGAGTPTATMHVRALDATGALLDEWIGPAYFTGTLPVSYQATRIKRGWSWTRDGEPSKDGARLKINSDAAGQAGRTLGEWAPQSARAITCDFAARTAPFAADASPLPTDGPSRATLPATGAHEADGSAPISGQLGATLDLEGPERPGAFRTHGALTVQDEARGSTISLGPSGASTVRLYGSPSEYRYRIAPQTSPRQRVLQLTATYDVGIETYLDPTAPIELVTQVRRVTPAELAALLAVDEGDASILRVRRPEISATGDAWRAQLRLGGSAITITALGEGARFAYWVDPEWRGNDRAVHVVATPGVRIDEAADPIAAQGQDPRRLVVNRLYVQDPRRVPQQGESIDPSQFVGIERHDNTPPELSPHPRSRDAFQVATSGTGVTVRDLQSGAALRIFAEDPTLGARFLHEVDGKQVRVLVGKGARIEIEQAHIAPVTPGEKPDPFFDFGQVDFQIYEVTNDTFPPPGTPLSLATLQTYGRQRGPDRVAWTKPTKSPDQVAIEALFDGGAGFAPGVGDLLDVADAAAVATMGTDKWGNELSQGEKIAVAVAAVLPLVTASAFLSARRLLNVAEAASPLAKVASKAGRTEEELHALLTSVRKLDDEGRAAARRIERAIELGDDVTAADLLHLESALGRAGIRTTGFTAPKAARFGGAGFGSAAAPLTRTPQLIDRERELQQALHGYARKLGVRGAHARARVEVIPKAHFVQRFASEQARAVCQITERGPVIVARVDATAQDLLDEAAHLAQLADPKVAPTVRYLDERNLADWPTLSVPDRFGFYETKLDVEIDAKRRALRVVRSEADRRVAEAALEDLLQRQGELAAISSEDLARMASGELPAPQFLNEPPRLFGKQRKVIEEIPSPEGSANLTDAGRVVDSAKGSADYSAAYSMDGVTEVRQLGNSWREVDYVTADLKGKIVSRTIDEDGATHLVVEGGGKRRDHIFEPGAKIDPKMKPGRKVEAGERLGKDSAREYRRVELTFADGAKHERMEIRSHGDGRSWVQRGQEATARGTAAEERARAAVDVELAARKAKGEILSYFHLPRRSSGGGFDDAIVEFEGQGEAMRVKVRVREVKDYSNRYTPLRDMSAVFENLENNLQELSARFSDAEDAIAFQKTRPPPFDAMTPAQIAAASAAIQGKLVHVELVLGPTTKLGTSPGERAVLSKLRARHPSVPFTIVKDSI